MLDFSRFFTSLRMLVVLLHRSGRMYFLYTNAKIGTYNLKKYFYGFSQNEYRYGWRLMQTAKRLRGVIIYDPLIQLSPMLLFIPMPMPVAIDERRKYLSVTECVLIGN